MRDLMLALLLLMMSAAAWAQAPTVSAVVNGASFDARLSPGVIAAILGKGFSTTASANTVLVGGQAAAVLFAAAAQLSVQFPYNLPNGPAALTVSAGGQTSTAFNTTIDSYAPGLLTANSSGSGLGTFLDANSQRVTTSSPAQPGKVAVAFAVGLGATNPAVAAGNGPAAPAPCVVTPTITVGGKAASVPFCGLVNAPGVYQLNFTVPPDVTAGDQEVIVSIGGKQSQPKVTLPTTMGIPSISGARNGATFQLKDSTHGAAPNSFISLYATNLGNTDALQNLFPATTFQGVSVLFNGKAAPLYNVIGSANQINLVTPSELPETGTVSVTIQNSIGPSQTFSLTMAPLDVGIFRIGDPSNAKRNNGAVLIANTAWRVMPASMATAIGFPSCAGAATKDCGQPASVGDNLQMYFTGGGKATPNGDPTKLPLATGSVAPADGSVVYKTVVQPTVTIGGVNAPVQFSGIAPGTAAEYQLNVAIPAGVQPGDDVPVVVTMGASSDTVTIAVK
jgi:uncharacterized protein (TIGR03437 family)